jgi:hypothetical protein
LNTFLTLVLFGLSSLLTHVQAPQKTIFKTANGHIRFISEAPLETITARSEALKGIIDTSKNTFAFSVSINSFKGFNSPLQEQHFYENYMESSQYPVATFSGKIIESIEFSKPGIYNVRAKGVLNIHGVKSERIIRSTIEVINNDFVIHSNFMVSLKDHNIKVPRIVLQKIAPDIKVDIDAVLSPVHL